MEEKRTTFPHKGVSTVEEQHNECREIEHARHFHLYLLTGKVHVHRERLKTRRSPTPTLRPITIQNRGETPCFKKKLIFFSSIHHYHHFRGM